MFLLNWTRPGWKCAPSKDLLEPLFAELEFRTLGRRVFGDDFSITEMKSVGIQTDLFGDPVATGRTTMTVDIADIAEPEIQIAAKNIDNVPHQYHLADTIETRAKLINILKQQKSFCFDTERKLPVLMPIFVSW
jgi:DNA polymerase-1